MNPGAWQHFIPAAHVGCFGIHNGGPLRKALLWVGRRGVFKIYQQTAENVAAAKNLYTLIDPGGWNPSIIDSAWSGAEGIRQAVFSALIGETSKTFIDAALWTLAVEQATHFFTRGIDFGERFTSRFPASHLRFAGHSDNVNIQRLTERQRLYSVVMRAEWNIVHVPDSRVLVLSDLGRAAMVKTKTNEFGYVIPLDARAGLALTRGSAPPRLAATKDNKWVVGPVTHSLLSEQAVDDLNIATASQARREIYGADPALIARLHRDMHPVSPPPELGEPGLLSGSSKVLRDRMMEYFQFRAFIRKPPSERKGMKIEDVSIFEAF